MALTTNFRTKPKDVRLSVFKENGMSMRPHVVELAEADDDRCKITMRFDTDKEAEQMAKALAGLLANAKLEIEGA